MNTSRIISSEGLLFHSDNPSGCRKRGVEFKGGSLRDGYGGFDGLGGSAERLTLLLLVLLDTAQQGNRGSFDGFGGHGGFSHDG